MMMNLKTPACDQAPEQHAAILHFFKNTDTLSLYVSYKHFDTLGHITSSSHGYELTGQCGHRARDHCSRLCSHVCGYLNNMTVDGTGPPL